MDLTKSESLEAGIHRLANGTDAHICDCDACLRKNKGKPKNVPRTTYFRHKPSRVARLFPPPTPAPLPAPSSSKRRLDAFDHPDQPPISKHKDDPVIALDGAENDLDIPEAADSILEHDTLEADFDHLEDTDFGDAGPEDREEEAEARVEDTDFGDTGPEDREEEAEAHVEEEEARIEDVIPKNLDPPDDVDSEGADTDLLGTMGWTDEDLDELHQMAHLEDAQDSMSFITALRKASLDDTHSKLPPDALDRLRNPPRELPDISDPDLILSLKYYFANTTITAYNLIREATIE
ncbi:hypothetical protein BDR07DRAFT_1607097 [Suillus spraguei]|nr:hypothetical protein BDR07DRAFT_1607097 [Suillus spraguei]